jgi:hypothetical protein
MKQADRHSQISRDRKKTFVVDAHYWPFSAFRVKSGHP